MQEKKGNNKKKDPNKPNQREETKQVGVNRKKSNEKSYMQALQGGISDQTSSNNQLDRRVTEAGNVSKPNNHKMTKKAAIENNDSENQQGVIHEMSSLTLTAGNGDKRKNTGDRGKKNTKYRGNLTHHRGRSKLAVSHNTYNERVFPDLERTPNATIRVHSPTPKHQPSALSRQPSDGYVSEDVKPNYQQKKSELIDIITQFVREKAGLRITDNIEILENTEDQYWNRCALNSDKSFCSHKTSDFYQEDASIGKTKIYCRDETMEAGVTVVFVGILRRNDETRKRQAHIRVNKTSFGTPGEDGEIMTVDLPDEYERICQFISDITLKRVGEFGLKRKTSIFNVGIINVRKGTYYHRHEHDDFEKLSLSSSQSSAVSSTASSPIDSSMSSSMSSGMSSDMSSGMSSDMSDAESSKRSSKGDHLTTLLDGSEIDEYQKIAIITQNGTMSDAKSMTDLQKRIETELNIPTIYVHGGLTPKISQRTKTHCETLFSKIIMGIEGNSNPRRKLSFETASELKKENSENMKAIQDQKSRAQEEKRKPKKKQQKKMRKKD